MIIKMIARSVAHAIGVEAGGEKIEEGAPLVMAPTGQTSAEDGGGGGAAEADDEPKEYFTIWNVVPLSNGICDL